MFGLGMPEILLILAIALIVIGPKRLPELAKTLGRAMGEFKRSAQDLKRSIDLESTVQDVPAPSEDLKTVIKEAKEDPKTEVEEEPAEDKDKTAQPDSDFSEEGETSDSEKPDSKGNLNE
ncbi:twin-arginine translocase TatA/TatE family subunit [Desulfospira joergensenii]|uniref:twin-arginine translocase TatA/TatE family subunit n=1 Tax=Desulfospira joergensenii TaxID=53329 RepID=UPI0003B43293|nr:twin-arginine translocase TatA/TatE family subunit [Desulfospira joergensenii]